MNFSQFLNFENTQMYNIPIRKESSLQVSVFTAGFTALIIQVVFLRSFLTILNGNELIIGIILANWMLLTAAGAGLAKPVKSGVSALTLLHVITGLLPALLVCGIYLVKARYFPPGILPGLYSSWLFTFLAMAPFCLASGAMFTIFAKTWSQYAIQNKTSRVYTIEALGSLTGSLLFILLLIRIFDIPEILVLLASANFSAAIVLSFAFRRKPVVRHLVFIGLLIWIMLHFVTDWYGYARWLAYHGQTMVEETETPYGNVVVTRSGEQLNVYENGISAFSSGDVISREESVHYAMLQLSRPESVLVISGNINGMWKEIKKYGKVKTDFVEVNPYLVSVISKYFGLPDDTLLSIHRDDPVAFLRKTTKKYDAILLNVPPPATLQFNRFYSEEFFNLLRSHLSEGGVISLRLEGNINYPGREMLELYGVLTETARQVFAYVIIVPGQSGYLLASRAPLSWNLASLAEQRNIDNEYVNPFYLDDQLLEIRGKELMEEVQGVHRINTDFRPVAFFLSMRFWLTSFRVNTGLTLSIAIFLLAGIFLLLRTPGKAMFVAGFTAASVEVMVLMAFQVIFGNLYQALALLLAAFMGGLALGTFWSSRIKNPTAGWLILNQALTGISALLLPLLIFLWSNSFTPDLIIKILLYLIMVASGIFTGVHFSLANALTKGAVAGKASQVYAADLAGSAGGALLIAILVIPFAGISGSGLILCGINVLMIVILVLFGRRMI